MEIGMLGVKRNRFGSAVLLSLGVAFVAFGLLLGASAPADAGWQLAWSDEFNAGAWTAPNSGRWNRETGGGGWGNNEWQVYTTSTNNARHDGAGSLIIEARRESNGSYTSARLNTSGKFSVTYGKIEARIAMPKVQGTWPAFWGIGTNFGSVGWPRCGEIDIMEHVNTNDTIVGSMHWDNNGYSLYNGSTTAAPVTNYHTYMLDWNPWSLNWFVDGRLYRTGNILNNINSTEEFHRPFFLILNMAVGGNWPGAPGSTGFPAQMKIDYVRVYRWVN
jgi:beta-glucanase (GH16 family)